MSVSLRRGLAAFRALLGAVVVVGLVAFVATPSFASSPLPTVTSVSPNSGAAAGGSSVTISGSGFTGATGVTFGGTAATSYTVQSAGVITAVSPAHAAGVTDVQVTGITGTSAVAPTDHFTYELTPAVTTVSPIQGALAGGNTLTVNGSGFLSVTSVNFGSTQDTNFSVLSSTQLTAVVPAGLPSGATQDVTVTGAYGTSAAVATDHYTAEPAPTVSAVSAGYGVTVGGGPVTITGANFVNVTGVTFGGVAGTSVVTTSSTSLTVNAPAHVAGTVDVVVTTIGQTSAVNSGDQYIYAAAPVISSVAPVLGTVNGGTTVTINGTGFTGATGVLFGTTAVAINSNTGTQISVTAPAHIAGVVDVRVVLGDGDSAIVAADHYTYMAIPVVTAVTATTGPTAGGATVVITGTGFTLPTTSMSAMFGSTAATVVSSTATTLTVKAPAGSVGLVDVTVTSLYGTSVPVTADHYTYVAAPTVTGVSPAFGLATGGTRVTVTGTGFTGITSVTFGGVAGTAITVVSATSLTVTVPARSGLSDGKVQPDVIVTGTYGSSAAVPADVYTYYAVPVITSLSNNAGPLVGGNTIVISGTAFTGATGVLFGTVPATSFTVNSDNSISATVPANAAATLDVRVQLAGGLSAITTVDHYTFEPLPTVTAISPAIGPVAGGTKVTVTGANFLGANPPTVTVGGVAATVTPVSATSFTFITPTGTAGVQDIIVTTSYGTSVAVTADHFTYVAVPTVTGVSPASGLATGGTAVTVTGTSFTALTSVKFGTVAATFTVVSPTQLTATVPVRTLLADGTVEADVVVAGTYGTSTVNPADEYTYYAVPVITSLSTNAGPLVGGGNVVISGTALAGASGVLFGTTAATIVSANDNSITVTIPAHVAGLVDVRVQLAGGMSAIATADHYTYQPLPTVTAVSPAIGPASGGTKVTVAGANFLGNMSVTVGGVPATNVTLVSSASLTFVTAAGTAGVQDVIVTSSYGTSIAVTADHFTYVAAPTVTGVSPASGLATGGTAVTVTGTSFTAITSVKFAGVAATFTVVSPTQLTVTVPVRTLLSDGNVQADVVVAGTYGTSVVGPADVYTYYAVPVITSLSSNAGPLVGGESIVISGTAFNTATGVLFGTTPGTNFTVTNDNTISVTVPAHVAGLVDVRVQLAGGMSAVATADHFTYQPLPTVTAVSPANGALVGGTKVTVTGANFLGTMSVTVGGVPATNVTLVSSTSLTFLTPAESAGTQDVVVTSSYGTSLVVAADHFTYQPLPTVSGLSVTQGVLGGANIITVTGTGFLGVTAVDFGTTASAKVTTVSATSLTVTVPAHVAGTVDVTVVGAYGTSLVVPADQYIYEPVPVVTSISSSAGPIAGGNTLTIYGTGILNISKVTFGTALGTIVSTPSTGEIIVTVPAHAAGTVDVQLVGAYGTSVAVAADHYLYQASGSIAGTVTGTGTPNIALSGVQVSAYNSSGAFVASATTSSTGTYTISGLGLGTYTLDFTPTDNSYAPQWYLGASVQSNATAISVGTGQAVTGANVLLTRAGMISGTVSGTGGTLSDVNITAYDASGNFAGGAQTNPLGNYVIPGLAAGTYTVVYAPEFGTADASTYAPLTVSVNVASLGGPTTSSVTLVAGASVSGVVKNSGNTGISGVEVDVYNASGGWVGDAITNGSGQYQLNGLASGTYTVDFTPASVYGPQWYGGVIDQSLSTPVVVTTGNQALNTVTLTQAASLSGTVVNSSSAGVSGVEVLVYDAAGNYVTGAVTDTNGHYAIAGLAAASYTVEFVSPTAGYASQWNGGATTEAEASAIVLAVGGSGTANATLVSNGSISGNVFGTSGTTTVTLSNVSVEAFDAANQLVETATTDTFGNYTLAGLAGGTYTVDFVPNNSPYGAQWWNGTAAAQTTHTAIGLANGQTLVGVNITLTGASISGTVSGTAGGLAGVDVFAVDAAGDGIGETTSASNGTYTISGIPTGSYTLEFVPSTSAYATQWFTGQPTEATATFIAVTPGLVVTGKNVTLAAAAGAISGTVTDTFSDVLDSVYLEVYDAAGNFVQETVSGTDGTYSVTGLPTGSYRVFAAADATYGTGYVDQWYTGKTTLATATAVPVTSGAAAATANFALVINPSIVGQVVGAGATGLDNVDVTAYNAAGVAVGFNTTSGGGFYDIDGLAPGAYTLDFVPEQGVGYAPGWYLNQATQAAATRITLVAGPGAAASTETLGLGASITGTVTAASPIDLSNVEVDAFNSAGVDVATTFPVFNAGNSTWTYTLPNLVAGTYTIDFSPNGLPWWYGQSAFGAQLTETVTAAQNLTVPTSVTLESGGGSISGTVTAADGTTAVAGVTVTLDDPIGFEEIAQTTTNGSGAYTFAPIPFGSYVIDYAPATGSGYAETWNGGASSESTASLLQLTAATSSLTNVNVALPTATASISGYVYGADAPTTGLSGQQVQLYLNGSSYQFATTASNGNYVFNNLPAGTYTMQFQGGNGYAPQWWNNATESTATQFVLASGAATSGYSTTLALAGASISGTVYGANHAPVLNGFVGVYDSDGNFVNFTTTDPTTGMWSLTGLGAGSYTLEVRTGDGIYADYWWKGQTAQGTATPIVLTTGETLTGINPQLSLAASISGNVSYAGSPATAAAYAGVSVFDMAGDQVAVTVANILGSYTITGLQPGVYTLEFAGSAAGFAPQWLGGAATEATASTITVLGNQQITGKNAVLAKGATISGTVVGTGAQKLQNIAVVAWQLVGSTYVLASSVDEGAIFTSGSGTYVISGLTPGTYKIEFTDGQYGGTGSVYQTQYWSAEPTLASATAITVVSGSVVTGVNATMTKLSSLLALTTTPVPTVTGSATATLGTVLTAVPGTWAPATVVLTYQWSRDGVAILGATSATYTPTTLDVGQTLTVTVTGQRIGYATTSKQSAPTAVVAN